MIHIPIALLQEILPVLEDKEIVFNIKIPDVEQERSVIEMLKHIVVYIDDFYTEGESESEIESFNKVFFELIEKYNATYDVDEGAVYLYCGRAFEFRGDLEAALNK